MKYIAILGSNARFSYNRILLNYMKRHFAQQAEITVFEIKDIPFFCEDDKDIPERVMELVHLIQESDGVIFGTPEYNHVITAPLKSLLEWLSWEKTMVLKGRPVMIVGTSLGNLGTSGAQACLRTILDSPNLECHCLAGNQFLLGHAPQAFDEEGNLINPKTTGFLENCFDNFVDFSQKINYGKSSQKLNEIDASKQLSYENEQGEQIIAFRQVLKLFNGK